jgi:hypothetical protein
VSCPVHSFTGSTRVLLADGSAKAIDHVRVGDVIANSVPGVSGTAAHKVTAVIVTHTDHDFVDVTIKKTGDDAARGLTPFADTTRGRGGPKDAKRPEGGCGFAVTREAVLPQPPLQRL